MFYEESAPMANVPVITDLPQWASDHVTAFISEVSFADGKWYTLMPGWQQWQFGCIIDDKTYQFKYRARITGSLPVKLMPVPADSYFEDDAYDDEALALSLAATVQDKIATIYMAAMDALEHFSDVDKQGDPSVYHESGIYYYTDDIDRTSKAASSYDPTNPSLVTVKVTFNYTFPPKKDLPEVEPEASSSGVDVLTGWYCDFSQISMFDKITAAIGGYAIGSTLIGSPSTKD